MPHSATPPYLPTPFHLPTNYLPTYLPSLPPSSLPRLLWPPTFVVVVAAVFPPSPRFLVRFFSLAQETRRSHNFASPIFAETHSLKLSLSQPIHNQRFGESSPVSRATILGACLYVCVCVFLFCWFPSCRLLSSSVSTNYIKSPSESCFSFCVFLDDPIRLILRFLKAFKDSVVRRCFLCLLRCPFPVSFGLVRVFVASSWLRIHSVGNAAAAADGGTNLENLKGTTQLVWGIGLYNASYFIVKIWSHCCSGWLWETWDS